LDQNQGAISPETLQRSEIDKARWPWLAWLLPLPALLLYGAFLGNPPFFDDLNGPFWKLPVPWPEAITPRVVTWLSFLPSSYWPETALHTLRAGNLLLHIGTTLVSYALINTLLNLGTPRSTRHQRDDNQRIALLGALLFSLHPVATYGVGYLIQRTILLATFSAY